MDQSNFKVSSFKMRILHFENLDDELSHTRNLNSFPLLLWQRSTSRLASIACLQSGPINQRSAAGEKALAVQTQHRGHSAVEVFLAPRTKPDSPYEAPTLANE
jgi:hypothetical protein